MHGLISLKETIYYSNIVSSANATDSNGYYNGEMTYVYGTPVEIKMNISEAKGNTKYEQFGIIKDYNKQGVTFDMSCPITENSRIWIGITPTNNTPHNYIVTLISKSKNTIVYGFKEVSTK